MNYWLIGFLSGMFIMSAFATIGMALMDEGKSWGIWFGGVAAWILLLYCYIYRGITTLYRRLNYRALMVCPDGEIRSCPSHSEIPDVLREFEYKLAVFDNSKWKLEWWRKEDTFLCKANMRYTPRKVWKNYERISKDVIDEAMELWEVG